MLPVSKGGWIKLFAGGYTATFTTERGVTCLGSPMAAHCPGHRSTPLTRAQIYPWNLAISVYFSQLLEETWAQLEEPCCELGA